MAVIEVSVWIEFVTSKVVELVNSEEEDIVSDGIIVSVDSDVKTVSDVISEAVGNVSEAVGNIDAVLNSVSDDKDDSVDSLVMPLVEVLDDGGM